MQHIAIINAIMQKKSQSNLDILQKKHLYYGTQVVIIFYNKEVQNEK